MELQALRDKISDYEALIEKQRNHINTLHEIGTALSAENNLAKLLDMILEEAKKFTNADGGTLYLVTEDAQSLQFDAVHTDSLNIRMGGKHGAITWPPLPLYKDDGSPNKEMVAALCAIEGRVINIPDVYQAEGFNFDGPKQFDKANNYLTKSMLVVPMKNYEDEVIGVVQLINATDPKTKEFISFGEDYERSTLSLTSQAAIVITNVRLINDLRELLESFIKSIASAIDAKSPYTGGHVRKVAEISMLIANELNEVDEGHYKNVKYNDDELNQIRIAALMHDVGKITTPEYVMDKSTKLETIYDRIETVITKMELFRRDKKIAFLEAKMSIEDPTSEDMAFLEKAYENDSKQIDDDIAFLKQVNIGGEFMADDQIERVQRIANHHLTIDNQQVDLLTEDEVKNFSIRKGTLTDEERERINFHATMSNTMLEALPFPKKLARVPEIAGGHHEKLNGKGYPKGLDASQLTLEARILAVADIFEALTASDRPYKEAKGLKEVMRILDFMVKDEELDPDLMRFVYDQKLHIRYAKAELLEEQLDLE